MNVKKFYIFSDIYLRADKSSKLMSVSAEDCKCSVATPFDQVHR